MANPNLQFDPRYFHATPPRQIAPSNSLRQAGGGVRVQPSGRASFFADILGNQSGQILRPAGAGVRPLQPSGRPSAYASILGNQSSYNPPVASAPGPFMRMFASGGGLSTPPAHLAQARDNSIRANGYGTPDGRGGYSSFAESLGYSPVAIQRNLNPTSHFGSLAGGGQRAAGLSHLAAQSAVQGIPQVSPFRLMSNQQQSGLLRHLAADPGYQYRGNGVTLPAGVGHATLTPQALANFRTQHYGSLLAKFGITPQAGASGLDLKSQYQQALVQGRHARIQNRQLAIANQTRIQNGMAPLMPRPVGQGSAYASLGYGGLNGGAGPSAGMAVGPGGVLASPPGTSLRDEIGKLMSQQGLSKEAANASLRKNHSDQQLQQMASQLSPGTGFLDTLDWLGFGLSDEAKQRQQLYAYMNSLGHYPPGQAPQPANIQPTTPLLNSGPAPTTTYRGNPFLPWNMSF